jgi:hypothetical protein
MPRWIIKEKRWEDGKVRYLMRDRDIDLAFFLGIAFGVFGTASAMFFWHLAI